MFITSLDDSKNSYQLNLNNDQLTWLLGCVAFTEENLNDDNIDDAEIDSSFNESLLSEFDALVKSEQV